MLKWTNGSPESTASLTVGKRSWTVPPGGNVWVDQPVEGQDGVSANDKVTLAQDGKTHAGHLIERGGELAFHFNKG